MNIEITLAIITILIGTATGVIFSNFFKKYEEKIIKIKSSILGFLVNARNDLVNNEMAKHSDNHLIVSDEQKDYNDLIAFMKNSNFLQYANEYEDMLIFEAEGDRKITYLALEIGGLCVPTILLQQEGMLFSIGYLFLLLNLVVLLPNIISIIKMIQSIDKLHRKYVIGQQSFGGYDL